MRDGLGEQAVLLDAVEHGDRGRAGHRVAAEGAAEAAGLAGIHDLGAPGDAGQRQAARDALGAQHQIGHQAEVLAGEVAAGARHAALDLVGDEHDAVRRAPLLQRGQEAVGRHDEAALALDRLDDQAGQIGCADRLLEVRDGARGGIRRREAVVQRVRVRSAVDVAGERPVAAASRASP